MFDLQQRWYGIENLDKGGSLLEQVYLPRQYLVSFHHSCEHASKYYMAKWLW